ncbi:hypothetical protein COCCADRAFT_95561 [Bipolaris zeicola 26-R-13]|uniref:Peptidase A1 domain-containing protein n=1 Tax=Cochliobolus carbonum (strain 26-R-13) TaxID=930089 RepID=W6Y7X7_COCC2|nr:uncharacterized protein COCCADRAFT_95561 [Bipolaris zeicola 26-R-13]EUC33610.1 hypothetical protein COCCADRAFT_95561 [Bipolaris zeicola 26-R-13]
MSRRQLCQAALVLQTLIPLSSGAFFENNADALREFDIPVARSVHPLNPLAKRDSGNSIAARSADRNTGPTRTITDGTRYAIDVTLGGKTHAVEFDTGSNSFWLPSANFTCFDIDSKVKPQSTCGFASVGPAEYTGGRIPNINFNSTYLTAEFARGSVGLEDVTIAGLTVRNQHMSLAEKVFLSTAYNMTSGIIGWGLGNYTAYYPGDNSDLDNKTDPNHTWIATKTWIQNAVEQGLVEKPIFSVNLGNRTENAANLSTSGFVAVGGAPLDGLPFTGVWAQSKVSTTTFAPWSVKNKYTHWNTRPDGFTINQTFVPWVPGVFADGGEIFTILDTGTPWSYVPDDAAKAIAEAIQPPAYYSVYDSSYIANCNATVPHVSLRINGTDLPINKRDVLLDGWLGHANGSTVLCWLGFQPALQPKVGGTAPFLLGNTFLRNVLAVHDLGNLRMLFASLKW